MIGKHGSQTMTTNRKYKRDFVNGYVCEIADGNQVMSGVVDNVSSAGLKISSLPTGFSVARKHHVAVVSGDNRYFKVLLRPCWSKKEEGVNFMDVGFKILDAPWEWMEFISIKNPTSSH